MAVLTSFLQANALEAKFKVSTRSRFKALLTPAQIKEVESALVVHGRRKVWFALNNIQPKDGEPDYPALVKKSRLTMNALHEWATELNSEASAA
jgi:hypothetical protein